MKPGVKDIKGYEGLYQVTCIGLVKSLDRIVWDPVEGDRILPGKTLKQSSDAGGYLRVGLWRDDVRETPYVHRLVCAAFIGPCPVGMVVRHLNGDRADNRLSNLAYGQRGRSNLDPDIAETTPQKP